MSSLKIEKVSVSTKACGALNIFIQGIRASKDVAVITVHDLGCNHNEFVEFVNHEHMNQLAQRCFWVHVEVPGQGAKDVDLPANFQFPTMQKIAEGLSEACDILDLKHIVVLGDGAGANILARLAILRADITLGAILIHCTGTTAGFMESIRDKFNSWKLNSIGMHPKVESYLLLHRFGLQDEKLQAATNEVELNHAIGKYLQSLRETINPKNLNRFIQAFMERTNITECIGNLKCPALFLTGSLASFNHTVYTLYNALLNAIKDQPSRRADFEILEIDGVANVIREAPEKVAESIQNFLQGLGVASGAMNRRMSGTGTPSARSRSGSMTEYDQPKGVKNLIYDNMRKYTFGDDMHEIPEHE